MKMDNLFDFMGHVGNLAAGHGAHKQENSLPLESASFPTWLLIP